MDTIPITTAMAMMVVDVPEVGSTVNQYRSLIYSFTISILYENTKLSRGLWRNQKKKIK